MRNPRPELSLELQQLVRDEVERVLAERAAETNRVTMVVFSGDLDRVIASLVIATGAAAMGMKVSMFFTFWGLSAIKRGRRLKGKRALEKGMALMTPSGLAKLGVSKLHFGGIGPKLMRKMMKDKNVASAEELFAAAREAGVRIVGCTMTMDVFGLEKDDLVDGVELGGASAFLGDASQSRVTLFI